jgi:hypothetical protein
VPFRQLLGELVAAVPGARGAIFCDYEGESVDLHVAEPQPAGCGALSLYDLKVCGAQLTAAWLLLQERSKDHGAGLLDALRLRTDQGTLLCAAVKGSYYLTLLLAPATPVARAALVLEKAARRFAEEM